METEAGAGGIQWKTAEPKQPANAPEPENDPAETGPLPNGEPHDSSDDDAKGAPNLAPAAAALAPAGPDEPTDPAAELAKMRQAFEDELAATHARLAELEQSVAAGVLRVAPADDALIGKVADRRDKFAAWPVKGGLAQNAKGDSIQPWDLEALDLPVPGKTRDYLPGG